MNVLRILMTLTVAVIFMVGNCSAMEFSQPVQIGNFGFPIQAQIHGFVIKGATHIEGTYRNENDVSREAGQISKTYVNGIAQFGEGTDALFAKYDFNAKGGTQFGGKNAYIVNWNESYSDILKIETNGGITLYVLYHEYCTSHLNIIGKQKDGKWVSFIDSKKVSDMYFNGKDGYKLKGGVIYEKPKCQGDTIIIPYRRWDWNTTPGLEGEIRLKWDEKAQWFGIEKVVY